MSNKWEKLMSSGSNAMEQQRFKLAVEEFGKAQRLAARSGDEQSVLESQSALACALAADKQYLEAAKVYLSAISLCQENNSRYPLAMCMCSLAHVYRELKDFEKARSYALQAATIFETEICEDPAAMFIPFTLLADLSLNSGDRDAAIYFLSKASLIAERFPSPQNTTSKLRETQAKLAAAIVVSNFDGVLQR